MLFYLFLGHLLVGALRLALTLHWALVDPIAGALIFEVVDQVLILVNF